MRIIDRASDLDESSEFDYFASASQSQRLGQFPTAAATPPVNFVHFIPKLDLNRLFPEGDPVPRGSAEFEPPVTAPELPVTEPPLELLDLSSELYFWLQHTEGRSIGDRSPFTTLGGTNYLPMTNGVFMFHGQGGVTNNGDWIGSFGLQRRLLVGETIVGGGLWYDVNQSPNNNVIQQGSFSLELLRNDWSIRTNG